MNRGVAIWTDSGRAKPDICRRRIFLATIDAMLMTYRLNSAGKQFVVVAAGGHGKLGTTLGDAVVAFALP